MPKQVKVLVVDDEEIILRSVRKILKSDDEHNFVIDTVLAPQEGLAFMNRYSYDLVITDLMMPGIDGLQFIDDARKIHKECKIIMITGYATMRTALQALRKGAFDYIAKPFTKKELLNVVNNALSAEYPSQADKEPLTSHAPSSLEEYRSFLNQTYVRIAADGKTYFGVESSFLESLDKPLSIEVCSVGDDVLQGYPFGTIKSAKMKVFNLRAPISGRVVEVNREAVNDSSIVLEDPSGRGWLVQIEPVNFKSEIENLAL
jgi:CheY-like chemotaxis protein/glycine cleavage system H lipoate-binding protein